MNSKWLIWLIFRSVSACQSSSRKPVGRAFLQSTIFSRVGMVNVNEGRRALVGLINLNELKMAHIVDFMN